MNGINYPLIVCMYASSIVNIFKNIIGPKYGAIQVSHNAMWRGGIRISTDQCYEGVRHCAVQCYCVSNVQKMHYVTLEWPPSC